MAKDLTYGNDVRGDVALFIEEDHFLENGDLDDEVITFLSKKSQPTFFRVISNGVQQRGHGWIEDGEIMQWG